MPACCTAAGVSVITTSAPLTVADAAGVERQARRPARVVVEAAAARCTLAGDEMTGIDAGARIAAGAVVGLQRQVAIDLDRVRGVVEDDVRVRTGRGQRQRAASTTCIGAIEHAVGERFQRDTRAAAAG